MRQRSLEMSCRIVFGLVSHGNRLALDELLKNLAVTCPNSEVIVFNTGPSNEWLTGFDGNVCRSSREMRFGRIADAHFGLMSELRGRVDYDCLVTLDSDMLIIKAGFETKVRELLDFFAYIGTEFGPFGRYEELQPMRFALLHWESFWSKIFESQIPYSAINPGQIFRRDLVEHLATDSRVEQVLNAVRRARTIGLEEIVYPTLAVARGFPATSNPGTHAIEQRTFSPDELILHHAHPDVFLVHKVSLEADAPDRLMIHSLVSQGPSTESVRAAAERIATSSLPFRTRGRLKNGLFWFKEDVKHVLRGP